MKHFKLPFNISLERKYNDVNIDRFINDWELNAHLRKSKSVVMSNDLHIELGKFKTFEISLNEIIDLGMRYAIGKQEFRKLAAQLIELKEQEK